ncbi:hypothetical protein ACFCYM_09690 [Streptomyces sp. NPDC056254]|uniref:hypothetical protein n=1 Tax=Streptomyces sp. NPDC056254 TaxID=3345763 RepID=UPI0035D96F49
MDAGQTIDADFLTRLERPPIAVLKQTVSQSIPNATWGIITFDTEDVDTYGGHSTSVNTSRYTCQFAGWYRVGGRAAFAANATGSRGARVHINANYIPGAATLTGAGTLSGIPQTDHILYLNVGDYVEIAGGHNSGGALSTAVTFESASMMYVEWIHA